MELVVVDVLVAVCEVEEDAEEVVKDCVEVEDVAVLLDVVDEEAVVLVAVRVVVDEVALDDVDGCWDVTDEVAVGVVVLVAGPLEEELLDAVELVETVEDDEVDVELEADGVLDELATVTEVGELLVEVLLEVEVPVTALWHPAVMVGLPSR